MESAEFDTLTSLITPYVQSGKPLPFGQLLLEIHVWHKRFPEFLTWWEMLEAAGLRPFSAEPNLVYQNYNKLANSELAEVRTINFFLWDLHSTSRPVFVLKRERRQHFYQGSFAAF